jgi:hypothetical protein
MNTRIVSLAGLEMRILDTPESHPIVHELEHAKRTAATLQFRARPDVLGEENAAHLAYEQAAARAAWLLLTAYSV